MTETNRTLASVLEAARQRAGRDLESLHVSTKVPLSTLEGLFGRADDFSRPPRAYLKGQVGLIARELGLPRDEAFQLFDASYQPRAPEPEEKSNSRVLGMAVACGLGGVSILAIVLAFVS